jgi:hypothetical protein
MAGAMGIIAALFVVLWWFAGEGAATAVATIAAIPVAVAAVVVPLVLSRPRLSAVDESAQATVIKSAPPRPIMILSVNEESGGADRLQYEALQMDGSILIQPRDAYLDAVYNGRELKPFDDYLYSPWEYRFKWPELDVKLVNNTGKTLVFHKAIFRVEESRPDNRAVPVISGESYGMYLPLHNLGWGAMEDCVIRFRLVPAGQTDISTPEFVWELASLDEATREGSLARFFTDSGVDVNTLGYLWGEPDGRPWYYVEPESGLGEPPPVPGWDDLRSGYHLNKMNRLSGSEYEILRRAALGPFADGSATIRGMLEYTQTEIHGSRSRHENPFVSIIHFNGPTPGAAMPPSSEYQVHFRFSGTKYSVAKNISHVIADGEADRFLLSIAADRSSMHKFILELVYNDRAVLKSDPISLLLFLSTGDKIVLDKYLSVPRR